MELRIQKWGNSAALCLPAKLLTHLKVAVGDKLTVEVRAGGLLLKSARRSYSLDELIAQCNTNAPTPADLAGWIDAPAAGDEQW